jgi:hypothetical protein
MTTVVSETRGEAQVHAEVNYVRNPPPAGDAVLEFVTEAEERSTMQTLPGRRVPILDTRGIATELDREGFVLVDHVSAVTDFDLIQQDPHVDQQYIDETTELLATLVAASRVFMLGGGKKRYGESATEKLAPLSNAKPARYAHADNTDTSAVGLVEMVAQFVDDLDPAGYSRWALYNVWRAVTPPPQDFPLAVCDARTVAPGDEITVAAVTEEHGFDIRHDTTGYLYNPAHEWHYYRDMTRDEVLVFKAHDTDPRRAGRVPHTAFTDPTCPPGVPTRASVEMRGLALFD